MWQFFYLVCLSVTATAFKLEENVPGEPGVDYPIYTDIPQTSFACSDFSGYFADIEAGCQVFHMCWDKRQWSFLCPNGTIFNQAYLVCDWWFNFDCNNAQGLYSVNDDVFVWPDGEPNAPNTPRPTGFGSRPSTNQQIVITTQRPFVQTTRRPFVQTTRRPFVQTTRRPTGGQVRPQPQTTPRPFTFVFPETTQPAVFVTNAPQPVNTQFFTTQAPTTAGFVPSSYNPGRPSGQYGPPPANQVGAGNFVRPQRQQFSQRFPQNIQQQLPTNNVQQYQDPTFYRADNGFGQQGAFSDIKEVFILPDEDFSADIYEFPNWGMKTNIRDRDEKKK